MARSPLTGTRIRERRTALGLRQSELARQSGISASYLNLIEHNRRRAGSALLARIAGALGVDAEALGEQAEAALLETLRDAATEGLPHAAPELERAEELVGRFPGWAGLIAAQHRRIQALARAVERMTDRMTHDPHLSAWLHEVLSVAASIRSTAAILAETEDIDDAWRSRFHRNIHGDSLRLAEGAQTLVRFLDASQDVEGGVASPQEELEAWLAARDFHLPRLEGVWPVEPEAVIAGDPALASGSARALALDCLRDYRADAAALPLPVMAEALAAHGPDPEALLPALRHRTDLPRLLRRLAALPPGFEGLPPVGLVVCDGSGTMTFRKPLEGFGLPRFGAACPLWPLFQALSRPHAPLFRRVEMAGRPAQRFDAYAICTVRAPSGFDGTQVLQALMLVLPAPREPVPERPLQVGVSCRICSRDPCPARREPAIVALGS